MTSTPTIQQALLRARETFERKPAAALHEDVPAFATWTGGLGMQLKHPQGTEYRTTMPAELGGQGSAPVRRVSGGHCP